jgi:CDP-diacylglycerol---glycerol-3-phosphate 3-phosphatidyltransferase
MIKPEFCLQDMIQRAQRRIFISSLYIGSEESELVSTLASALKSKPNLHLHLSLDLNRSTRPGLSSTAKILLPLLEEHPDRVHVSLFRSPSLRGIMAKIVPPRFNEGWGTWHAKVYGADDEVIISGYVFI